MSKQQGQSLTPSSVRSRLVSKEKERGSKGLTIVNKKGFLFQYFLAKYEDVYASPMVVGNKGAAFAHLAKFLQSYPMMTMEQAFQIIDHYIENYEEKWKRKNYAVPSIVFMNYVVNEVVNELVSLEKKEETGVDEGWL